MSARPPVINVYISMQLTKIVVKGTGKEEHFKSMLRTVSVPAANGIGEFVKHYNLLDVG